MLKEKCAVSGAIEFADGPGQAELINYEMLSALQHRGQEASGMASEVDGNELAIQRDLGLVRDVYDDESLIRLASGLVIGHNRYATNGDKKKHPQPFIDDHIDFAFAHNGNLPVTDYLEKFLAKNNISTSKFNDSEMMGLAIAHFIRNGHDLPDAVELAYPYFRGAFSCVALHDGLLVAFRDSRGIRPLELGSYEQGFLVASETSAIDRVDGKHDRSVNPGELVIIDGHTVETRTIRENSPKLDIFEMVYFADESSYLYGERVSEVRRRFGEALAKMHPPKADDVDNILVVPVPATSVPAAEGYARALKLPYSGTAIKKDRYSARTFIAPTQEQRVQALKSKHVVNHEEVRGKDLIVVEDSVLRMTTMQSVVAKAKAAGAKTITVLVASPPVRFSDYYGINTPTQAELVAANHTIEEVRQLMGVDYLGYLSITAMVDATRQPADMFNLSPFTGEYPIGIGEHKKNIKAPVSREYMD